MLRLRVTTKCNLHCDFCYLKGNLNRQESGVLSADEWGKIIGNMSRFTVVDITGAEPFLSREIKPILEHLSQKGNKASLTTNGMFNDENTVQMICENGVEVLMLSLDGLEDTHNELRGSERSFSNIFKLIHKLHSSNHRKKPRVIIKTTVTEKNYIELHSLGELLSITPGVSGWTLNLLFQNEARGGIVNGKGTFRDFLKSENTQVYSEDLVGNITKAVEDVISAGFLSTQIRPPMSNKYIAPYIAETTKSFVPKCRKYNSVLTLDYNGNLSLCDLNYSFANIRELNYDLSLVGQNEKYKELIGEMNSQGQPINACSGCCLGKHKVNK